jgi:hypothetical protein
MCTSQLDFTTEHNKFAKNYKTLQARCTLTGWGRHVAPRLSPLTAEIGQSEPTNSRNTKAT